VRQPDGLFERVYARAGKFQAEIQASEQGLQRAPLNPLERERISSFPLTRRSPACSPSVSSPFKLKVDAPGPSVEEYRAVVPWRQRRNSCSIPRSWNKTLKARERRKNAWRGRRDGARGGSGRGGDERGEECRREASLLRKHRCCIYVANIPG